MDCQNSGPNSPLPPYESGNPEGELNEQGEMRDPGLGGPAGENNPAGGVAVHIERRPWEEGESGSSSGGGSGGDKEDEAANTFRADDESEEDAHDDDHEVDEDELAVDIRPITAGWARLDGTYDDNEAFVPLPAVTFIVDRPRNLICQICRVSLLRFSSNHPVISDSMPALMPCGHIAGAVCLVTYLDSLQPGMWACPFCRAALVHIGCGHRVREKVLGRDTVRNLPATLPMGGEVPGLCPECRVLKVREEYCGVMEDARNDFVSARTDYDAMRTEEAARRLMRMVMLFETVLGQAGAEIARIRAGLETW